jgi:hypothetical protein
VTCVGYHPNIDDDQRPATEIGYLCLDCYSWLRSRILELPAIASWLEVFIEAGGNPGEEKVAGSREEPIPLRQDVLDLIGPDSRHYVASQREPQFLVWEDGLVVGVYATWAEAAEACHTEMIAGGVSRQAANLLRVNAPTDAYPPSVLEEAVLARTRWQIRPTERGGGDQAGEDSIIATLYAWARQVEADGHFDDWPTFTGDGQDKQRTQGWLFVHGFATYLAGHLSWIVEQPWVDNFTDDIRTLGQQAHRLAPWRAEIRHDNDPCTSCGVKAVILHIAKGVSRCEERAGGCGRSAPLSEYVLNATLPATRRTA